MEIKRWTPQGVGEKFVDVALSMSNIFQEKYDTKTVLASYSDVKATLTGIDAIFKAIEELEKDIAGLTGHPKEYLSAFLTAHKSNLRGVQGDIQPYSQRLWDRQQLVFNPMPESLKESLEERLTNALAKKGYKGKISEMVISYLEDTVLPPKEVTAFAKKINDKLRAETLEKVVELPDDEEIIDVKEITGVFWSGFSAYHYKNKGSLTFNIERPWSVPTFVNVLSHESYPGHQTYYCLWDHLYLTGRYPIEASMFMYNTPTNTLFEGAPENGLEFLGWLSEEETPWMDSETRETYRIGRDIQDLHRFVMTKGCYLHHMEGATAEEAVAYMMGTGFFREIEAKNSARFFTDPIKCTYYPTYYYGRYLINRAFRLYDINNRKQFFDTIYRLPQTNETLIAAVKEQTGKDFRPFDNI